MSNEEFTDLQKLEEILVRKGHWDTNESHITPRHTLEDDIDLDSIDRIDMVMDIEKEWDITISDPEMERLRTVEDVLRTIRDKTHIRCECGTWLPNEEAHTNDEGQWMCANPEGCKKVAALDPLQHENMK